jgi:hypothetical protein
MARERVYGSHVCADRGSLGNVVFGQAGQASVEYVLVFVGLLSLVLSVRAVWAAGRDGVLLGRAIDASSHLVGGGLVPALQDVLLF